ncbi:response regulator transcription factor [Seohaeicola nanhaiensis]|uniref:Response regulator transcription factor n=1 Tax=Seohaeicola nanhaiensis TaxID=1387282 RepID=A0ABV9KH61_9RHOB
MVPIEIGPQFFRGDLRVLNRAGHETHAFLLVANPDLIAQILQLRRSGISNPILVLRAARDADNAAQALDAGADDDIVMPIRAVELKARINAVLRRAHGHAADSITIGEVTAFFDGRDPEVGGHRVKLSRREHKVFQQLVLNARKVTSKAAIYDAVYGMSDDQPFDKVIDVYICKIRKKIGQAAPSGYPYIETVHGRGYKFDTSEPDHGLRPVAAE